MKVRQHLLICALFLAVGATTAGAAPVNNEKAAPAREKVPLAEAPATDVFGVSVIASAGGCGLAAAKVTAQAGDPWSVCGSCSVDICDGAAVNSICGFSGGQYLRCQDWLGSLCPRQDGARCRCSNAPIP